MVQTGDAPKTSACLGEGRGPVPTRFPTGPSGILEAGTSLRGWCERVCGPFVVYHVPCASPPQAHTPFQWFPVRKEADARLDRLAKAMRTLGVDFNPESYKWSVIQVLACVAARICGAPCDALKVTFQNPGTRAWIRLPARSVTW